MAVATATALLIAAAVTAAGATAQGVQANQAKQDAKGAANAQKDQMAIAGQKADAASAEANNQANNDYVMSEAKKRQQAIAGSAQGKGSTILTSPLGAVGAPATANKTLLGL